MSEDLIEVSDEQLLYSGGSLRNQRIVRRHPACYLHEVYDVDVIYVRRPHESSNPSTLTERIHRTTT